jgi:multiple sugar transport system permease protein
VLDLSAPAARTVFAIAAALIGFFLFFPIYWLAISAFKGNAELYRLVLMLLSAQVFPFGLLLISLYPMLTDLGLVDTRLGLLLSYIVFALPVSTYMLYSYFSQVPSELIEAARADGASELRIFHTIILPVSVPAVVTVFLYGFMWSWNDLLYAMTLIVSEDKRTVGPGLLLSYLNEVNADWGGAMAASLIASAPIVVAFAFLQRWFIQGVTAGSVK